MSDFKEMEWWARQGLNLRPLRCQHSALPLSYAPTREAGQYRYKAERASPFAANQRRASAACNWGGGVMPMVR